MINSADLNSIIQEVKLTYSASTVTPDWFFAPEVYKRMQWLAHCYKMRPLPTRPMRKVHMRKMYHRRQQEKRRWLA